jgi:hypothetical protein
MTVVVAMGMSGSLVMAAAIRVVDPGPPVSVPDLERDQTAPDETGTSRDGQYEQAGPNVQGPDERNEGHDGPSGVGHDENSGVDRDESQGRDEGGPSNDSNQPGGDQADGDQAGSSGGINQSGSPSGTSQGGPAGAQGGSSGAENQDDSSGGTNQGGSGGGNQNGAGQSGG